MDKKLSELDIHEWAVIDFEKVLNDYQTYDEAISEMMIADGNNESGVCIVTQNVADRLQVNKLRRENNNGTEKTTDDESTIG